MNFRNHNPAFGSNDVFEAESLESAVEQFRTIAETWVREGSAVGPVEAILNNYRKSLEEVCVYYCPKCKVCQGDFPKYYCDNWCECRDCGHIGKEREFLND